MTETKKTTASAAVDQVEAAVAAGKENVETVVKAGAEAASRGYEQAVAMTNEQVETAFKAGSEAVKGYEDIVAFGKDNVDAVISSGAIFAKGLQDFNKVWFGFAQASMQESVAATKAILGCKSAPEALSLQLGLAKSNYAKAVTENRKMADMSAKLSEAAIEPITKRVTATVEKFAKPLST